MKLKNLFLGVFLGLLLLTTCTSGKRSSSGGSRRSGSSSSGSRYQSRTTSRPHTQQNTGGSNTGGIGWNVPSKTNSNPVGAPPSYDSIHKTSATNVQSSNTHNKPASYPTQAPYNPSVSGGYNSHPQQYGGSAPYGQSHNPPPYSQSQHPSYGHNPPPYNPSYNAHPSNPGYGSHPSNSYHGAPPPAYTPYNPYQSHSYSPGAGYNPPVGHAPQTILVQSGSSKPGIGQLAKEAFVYAGVSAGVNAAVNRILPGGISGHRNDYYPSSGQQPAVSNGVVPTVTHTQITYNNYYNNGSAAPAAPVGGQAAPVGGQAAPVGGQAAPVGGQAAPVGGQVAAASSAPVGANDPVPSVVPLTSTENINNQNSQPPPPPTQPAPLNENQFPSPSGAIITKTDVQQFTENLFENDKNNAFKYITMQLQGQKMDDGVKDDAPEPLLVVKDEAYEIPTIRAVLALHDNYALDVKTKETPNAEKNKEENDMLDAFMETDVMKKTMQFLSEKGFLPEYEFRDALKRIWFSLFKRTAGEAGSSGFETVFLAEKFDNEIIGMHNWIYYAKQEAAKNMNYLGYIKETKLGTNGAIVKLRSSLNDIIQPVTTIFVGTSPELEMALYTMCFYVRPNVPCPIKLGGTEFIIIANAINYYGKDILISAFPEI